MTFEEAAKDPRRPLSLSPLEWMYSVEAKLNEEEELTERAAKRIAAAKKENKDENKDDALPEDSGTGVEKIDMGIDQLVSGCKIIDAGLREATFIDMEPKMRKHIDKIKELMETAIEPYLVDIIMESNKLDGEEEK